MDENPYKAPESAIHKAETRGNRSPRGVRRPVAAAIWTGAKWGASLGAALGTATVALILWIGDSSWTLRDFKRDPSMAAVLGILVLAPALLGALGVAIGFGLAATNRRADSEVHDFNSPDQSSHRD